MGNIGTGEHRHRITDVTVNVEHILPVDGEINIGIIVQAVVCWGLGLRLVFELWLAESCLFYPVE